VIAHRKMIRKLLSIFLISGCTWGVQSSLVAAQSTVLVPCPVGPGPVPAAQSADCVPAPVDLPPQPGLNGVTGQPGTSQGSESMPLQTMPVQVTPLPAAKPGSAADFRSTPGSPSPTSRPVPPLAARSEFEVFVEDAAGRPIRVYGRRLFDQPPTTFAPFDDVPIPANYVIGSGDELLIRVWGKIDLDTRVTVDRNGEIFLPKVGALTVAGLRYEKLEGFLSSAIGTLFKDFELSVTMGQLRSIQVYVLGSARQPGLYTVGSLSTLVNVLFASGGPSESGTMRRIQLRRGSSVVTEFDLYDLLRRGDKSHDQQLLPGDVIYIPPVGPQIAMIGSVNDPGIYEMRGETSISSALKDAGGLTDLAGSDRVLLERIEDRRRRQIDEFPLDALGLQRTLAQGDLLRIFPISPQVGNAVILRGSVSRPGQYLWHEGMRVSDLVRNREFLITRDYWNQQNHLVPVTRNRPFGAVPGGVNMLTGQQNTTVTISNARNETEIDDARNLSEINWSYASIERLDETDLTTHLVTFNLGNAIDNPASSDNYALKSGDVITVYSQKDLPLPVASRATFVRIDGEVNAPGLYRIRPGESLRDLVQRAGGLTPQAYLYGSQFTRVSTRLSQEQQLKQSTDQMQKDLMARYASASSPAAGNPTDQLAQLRTQQAFIAQLASVKPTGRVVLTLNRDASTKEDIPDFPLEDGDRFYIPVRLNTVQVTGAVYNENAFRYDAKKPLSFYLRDAGGPTRQADKKRIFLIRADGTVVSSKTSSSIWQGNSFENLTLLPGDAIIVPTKLKSNGFMQQLPFITQILSQVSTAGAMSAIAY
jgi:polysaccharide export outer membrane protein